MTSNPFKMSPANGALSRLYLSYSVPLSVWVWLRVWLGSWEIGPPTMELVRLRPSYRPLIHFRRHLDIARSSQNYRHYRGLCQELRELQQGTHDQEFASDAPDLNELNDVERWIFGKPEATVDQLAAHPSAVLLPWWHLIGRSRWDLPAAFIGTLVLNVFAVFVLFPLPLYSIAAVI